MQLGGKSPVIIAKDADLHKAARRMLSIKQLTSGQMCGMYCIELAVIHTDHSHP